MGKNRLKSGQLYEQAGEKSPAIFFACIVLIIILNYFKVVYPCQQFYITYCRNHPQLHKCHKFCVLRRSVKRNMKFISYSLVRIRGATNVIWSLISLLLAGIVSRKLRWTNLGLQCREFTSMWFGNTNNTRQRRFVRYALVAFLALIIIYPWLFILLCSCLSLYTITAVTKALIYARGQRVNVTVTFRSLALPVLYT
jgi:hypothetical protein